MRRFNLMNSRGECEYSYDGSRYTPLQICEDAIARGWIDSGYAVWPAAIGDALYALLKLDSDGTVGSTGYYLEES